MSERAIVVLVPRADAEPPPPEAWPFGRAALRLEAEGVPVVLVSSARGGRVDGHRARPGRWEAVRDVPAAAAFDRFPGLGRAAVYRALREGLGDVPLANPPSIDALCRDKLACQEALADLGFPEVEPDPERFASAVARWGVAFHKPRYGALGHGVRRVVPGDALPVDAEGAPGRRDPAFVQRAVAPPPGLAGAAVRALVQRVGDGFVVEHPVVRRSATDPVVNAARGAGVDALAEVLPELVGPVVAVAVAIARRLAALPDGALVVELGVDLVVDPDGAVHPIEVNGKPRGRLEVLAGADPRWAEAHVEASARPLRWLAARFR